MTRSLQLLSELKLKKTKKICQIVKEETVNTKNKMTFDGNIIEKEDKMDENTYANHVKNFKLKSTKIKKKIKMYTKEQVTLVDGDFPR